MVETNQIIQLSYQLAKEISSDVLMQFSDNILNIDLNNWDQGASKAIQDMPQQKRALGKGFLNLWKESGLSADAVALILKTAIFSAESHCKDLELKLAWTGPKTDEVPLRRTDQALLEIISRAKNRLLIVSYAVYKIDTVRQELINAAKRDVNIRMILDSPDPDASGDAYNNLQAMGERVAENSSIYIWPFEKRPKNQHGKPAKLHVKCAVADGHRLFLSSANLTEYAFKSNMELGVIIKGGQLPKDVENHFVRLIEKGELKRITG